MNQTQLASFISEFEGLMGSVAKGFHSASMTEIGDTEITFSQFILLNIISSRECPKMTDISGELDVTPANVSIMIEKLVKEGFVVRTSDPDDRRIVRVCLTPKGKGLIRRTDEKKKKNMAKIFENTSDGDRINLLRIMDKIARSIEKDRKGEKK